jgi:DNA-binding response OmpR family regulator
MSGEKGATMNTMIYPAELLSNQQFSHTLQDIWPTAADGDLWLSDDGTADLLQTCQLQDYQICLAKKSVHYQNTLISLAPQEYELICLLAMNRGRVFSRDQLIRHLWGSNYYGSKRTVDNLIWRIRTKLPALRLETVYGYGYRVS